MPKVACPCGYVHDLSPIPDDGWLVVRDHDYEALIDAELRAHGGPRAGQPPDRPVGAAVRVPEVRPANVERTGRPLHQLPGVPTGFLIDRVQVIWRNGA